MIILMILFINYLKKIKLFPTVAFDIDLLNYNIHPQFLVAPNLFFNYSYNNSNKYEGDWSRFAQENFVLDYFLVDWDIVLLSSDSNIEKSYTLSLKNFENLKNLKLMHL